MVDSVEEYVRVCVCAWSRFPVGSTASTGAVYPPTRASWGGSCPLPGGRDASDEGRKKCNYIPTGVSSGSPTNLTKVRFARGPEDRNIILSGEGIW